MRFTCLSIYTSFFNAVQNGIEKLVWSKAWMKKLRVLERFLTDKFLRRLSCATCLTDPFLQKLFEKYSGNTIDWRWETLCKALDQLIPLYETLQQYYDVSKMMVSEDGKSEATLLREVDEVLKSEEFIELCESNRTSIKNCGEARARIRRLRMP